METIILGGLVGLICVIAYKVIDNLNDRLKLVEDVIEYNVNILKDNYKIHEHLKRGFELDNRRIDDIYQVLEGHWENMERLEDLIDELDQ